jgi:hypothetical protein
MRGAVHGAHSNGSSQQQSGAEAQLAAAATVPDASAEELAVAEVVEGVQALQQALHLSDEQLTGQHRSR